MFEERTLRSSLFQGALLLAVAAVAVQFGYHSLRYYVIVKNLNSLALEINRLDESAFRETVAQELSQRGVTTLPGDLTVSLDEERNIYVVEMPFTWKLNLLVWKPSRTLKIAQTTPRLPRGLL